MKAIALRNGPTVPLAALELAWSLENQQANVRLNDQGLIRACRVTVQQRDLIQKHYAALVAIIKYVQQRCEEGR